MKKLILFLTIFAFAATSAFASSITPQKMTLKNSRDAKTLNKVTARIYKNLNETIDVSKYPPIYKDYRVMLAENTQSTSFYYVKSGDAELMYDKTTKELKYVSFRTQGKPRGWIFYNYPSGKLRQVDVWMYLGEVYSFNSDGAYIDYDKYVDQIRKEIISNLKMTPKQRAKYQSLSTVKPVKVELTIDHNGTLVQCKAIKQSKFDGYNQNIYNAIWKSSPFKSPYTFTTSDVIVKLEF